MESLLRFANGKSKRVCVLSWPSQVALNSIRNLWSNNHIVFPVLPSRAHRLVHLLAESRCDTLLVDEKVPDNEFVNIRENLGVPVVNMVQTDSPKKATNSRPFLFETRTYGSTIPIVGEKKSMDTESIRLPFSGSVLPYSSNWLLDAESSHEVVFTDSSKSSISPQNICVDCSTLDYLIGQTEQGVVDPSRTESIVVDIISRNAEVGRLSVKQLEQKLEIFERAKIFTRLFVPELGGVVADLKPIDIPEYISVPGIELKITSSGGLLAKPATPKDAIYVGRPKASADVFSEDGYMRLALDLTTEECSEVVVPRRERMKKKRVMQPDWRIRQVPIAVYHKKRGFKGQIYYTTKHKGWTFYRSRYYN